jgi:hypothetical protein
MRVKFLRSNAISFSLAVLFAGFFHITQPLDTSGKVSRQQEARPVARKFDEFEMNRASFGDVKARLDGFLAELQKETGSKAYIILHLSRRKAPRHRTVQIKNYIVETRRFPPDRLEIAGGAYREEPTLELWIVPRGAESPKWSGP